MNIESAGVSIIPDKFPFWLITHNGAVVGRADWYGGALTTAGEYLAYSAAGIRIVGPFIVDGLREVAEVWTVMLDGVVVGRTWSQAEAHRFALERWREIAAGDMPGAPDDARSGKGQEAKQ